MKVLTATARTQGQRANDFHWCVEGEAVVPAPVICREDEGDPDGGCGCGRSWVGLNSHRATTTAMVRDLDGYTADDYALAVRSSLGQQGWYPTIMDDESLGAFLAEAAELAASYPVGAVLETRLRAVYWRDPKSHAA